MNNTIITILTAVLITSCAARQEYKQPTEVATENLFRTDSLTLKGSSIESTETSIATTPWKEIFTDSHLQNLISKGLENNLDVLTAVQNIASAEAYLKQYGYFDQSLFRQYIRTYYEIGRASCRERV